jgi:hypothetical protein
MKDLFSLVKDIKGAQFAHIIYTADCGFPKKAGLGNVTKIVETNVQLNYNYLSVVRKRIERKGGDPNAFTEEKLPWGTWEIVNKVITHKGERYLRYYAINDGNPASVTYFVDGVPASPKQVADIKAYLASKDKSSDKQSACGLEDGEQVMPRSVKFSNVLSLNTDGETYAKPQTAAA